MVRSVIFRLWLLAAVTVAQVPTNTYLECEAPCDEFDSSFAPCATATGLQCECSVVLGFQSLFQSCIECGAAAAGTLDATYLLQDYTSVIEEYSSLCSGIYASPTVTATTPSATPSCGTAGGYITITGDADLMSISNCVTITGDLIITTGSALTSIDLPTGLQSVTGSLVFDGQSQSSATSISAVGLSSVGSSQSNGAQTLSDLINTSGLVIGNFPALGQFAFPNLATISSNLVVEQNPQLNTVTLPVLSTVGDNIDLTGDFNSIQLPDLQSVGGGVNVQSQSPSFQCPANLHTATKGSAFTCQGNVSQPVPGHDLSYTSTAKKSIATKTNSGFQFLIATLIVGWVIQMI